MAAQQFDLDNHDLRSRMDDLNDTLLELIFIRIVQWRHLVTCKCVSRRWNSIISNPDFARYLTKKHSAFTVILREGWDYSCLITEHPYFQRHDFRLNDVFPNNYRHIDNEIVAYHNDILVVCCASIELAYNITNPITKQFIVVPVPFDNPQYPRYHYQLCEVGFAGYVDGVSNIDVPNLTNNVMGFRIIRTITKGEDKLIGQIYYSETGKWRNYSVNNLGFKFKSGYICALTLNNKVHWRGASNNILVINPFVDDNVWYCVLNLPSAVEEDSVLGSCRNRLRIAKFKSSKVGCPRIKVWEFDDYDDMINRAGSTSTAKLRLLVKFALDQNLINLRCVNNKVICFHPGDRDIVYAIYNGKLLECDVINNKLRVISDCTKTYWSQIYVLVHPLLAP